MAKWRIISVEDTQKSGRQHDRRFSDAELATLAKGGTVTRTRPAASAASKRPASQRVQRRVERNIESQLAKRRAERPADAFELAGRELGGGTVGFLVEGSDGRTKRYGGGDGLAKGDERRVSYADVFEQPATVPGGVRRQ